MKKEASNTDNQSAIESIDFSEIEFPVIQGGKKGIGVVKYNPTQQAVENKDVIKGIVYLIESSGANYGDIAIWAFKESVSRNNVTCQELVEAYWKAYQDPYVGKEGIQFRHLWKHIEKMRTGDGSIYTYEQMLNKMDKEKIPMEAFTMIDEKDSQGRKKWVMK